MSIRGKSINLYLMDGNPSGRIKCTLANWTGIAYKIPRTELEKCKGREDLSQSGVYFLFGTSDETGENVVYIGQAGVRKSGSGILYRLQEHKRSLEKDYWTEAVVFTTSNNSFGPTEISYLENRFTSLARKANRYGIKNSNEPTSGNITEEKESELEEFIDNAKIVMGTLGHKVFEPLTEFRQSIEPEQKTNLEEDDLLLYIARKKRSGEIIEATCKQTVEGFVLLKGSKLDPDVSNSTPYGIKQLRKKVKIDKNILQEDFLFKSPSSAAAFVLGHSVSGPLEWKTKEGKVLRDMESEK